MKTNTQRQLLLALLAGSSAAICSPAVANDFSGPRIEAMVGWDSVGGELSYEDTASPDDDFSDDRTTDGIAYGVTAGYDFPLGDIFFAGVEASFDLSDNKKCEEVFGDDAACFKVKRNIALGGRVGTLLGKNTAMYVGAAYVNGKANVSYTDEADPDFDFSLSDERDGWRLSAGIEHNLANALYAKVEYRYSKYDDYAYADGTESVSLGFDRHQVLAGVGARF